MKRIFLILLCFLFCATACSGQKEVELPEVLLEIDGQTALTHRDFLFAQVYEGVSETDRKENQALFLRLAAESICMRIAEDYGESDDREEIEAEYEIYLESLETNGQTKNHEALRKDLADLTDEEFRDAFITYLYRASCAENLLKSIASIYENTTDAQTIREGILENLRAIAEEMEFSFYYPDTEPGDLDFEDVL